MSVDQASNASVPTVTADGRLLEQFLHDGNQEAFAALMRRHGPYLLALCQRLTYHAQDGEDVFQACFLELVRRASSITRHNSVAGWLQTVAVRLARKARARRARRQQLEMSNPPRDGAANSEDLSWREVRHILEEEVARLPEDVRCAIILCLFEGQTQEEAAQQLQTSARTIKDRVRRGRDILRQRLTRRGVSLAVLGALLSGGTAQAALPATLADNTCRGMTALAQRTPLAGVVPPGVLALSGSSFLAGWTLAALLLVALGLAATLALVAWRPQTPGPAVPQHAPPEPQVIQRSFRGKQFDANVFRWVGPRHELYQRPEDEGLRITVPAASGLSDAVGIRLRFPVRGDFDLEALVELLHAERQAARGSAGLDLYLFMDTLDWDAVWLGKMHDADRGLGFITGQRYQKRPDRRTKGMVSLPSTHVSGRTRLRIVRHGRDFSFLVAEGEAGDYQVLDTRSIDTADVSTVRLGVDLGASKGNSVDGRLIEFRMTADEFVGYPAAAAAKKGES